MLATILAVVVLTAPTAPADDPFVGTWTNLDTKTDGFTRLVITEKDGSYTLRGWGAAAGGEIDQGKTTLHLLADSIRGTTNKYGFATWEHKHATSHLTLYAADGGLSAECFTIFKDGSARSNYKVKYEFQKAK
jgi:hypothetical protein